MTQTLTTGQHRYSLIPESAIPAGVRFDTPRRNQGQIVEYSFGGFSRAEHDDGAPYMRVTDASLRADDPSRVCYYRLGR